MGRSSSKFFDEVRNPLRAVNINMEVGGRKVKVHCAVFNSENFDENILIGNDFLEAAGIVIDYARSKLYFLLYVPSI